MTEYIRLPCGHLTPNVLRGVKIIDCGADDCETTWEVRRKNGELLAVLVEREVKRG